MVEAKVVRPVMVKPVPEALPMAGVIRVGEVWRTFKPEPVLATENKAPPAVDWTEPAVRLTKVVEPVTVRVEEAFRAPETTPLMVKPVTDALPVETPDSQV